MMLDEGAAAPGDRGLCEHGDAPDLKLLGSATLGVPLRLAGAVGLAQRAGSRPVVGLAQERRRWRITPAALASLRPAAWIAGAALAIHAAALVADWTPSAPRAAACAPRMEARFRSAFPDAVAVADPALQMRRQLAAARHRAGVPDGGDFAPMIEKVAARR